MIEQHRQLGRGQRHHAVPGRAPDEASALQPLGIQRQPEPVMPERLEQRSAAATKDEDVAHERVAADAGRWEHGAPSVCGSAENAVERAIPPGKLIHAITDNYATRKHPKVRAWLERHPRWGSTSPRPRRSGLTLSRASFPP